MSDLDRYRCDPATFIDDFLPLNEKGEPWRLSAHQRKVLALAFRWTAEGRLHALRYLVWGELKKSGKTLLAAALTAWWAFTRSSTEVIVVANDEKQARGRVFRTLTALIEHNARLRASATIRATWIQLSNGTRIEAIALDYTGEAGGRQSLVSYDEPWGIMSERARRLFEELTPPPSEPESWVLMTTTAGFVGESELLEGLYRTGLAGERLDDDLEVYRNGTLTMFWGTRARQPWQTPEYYVEQRQTLRPNAFRRLHLNEWVAGTEVFVTAEQWDACADAAYRGAADGGLFIGVDAGLKNDNSAAVCVRWNGGGRLEVAAYRIWRPTPGVPLNLEHTVEQFVVRLHREHRVRKVVCDPSQMMRSIAALKDAGVNVAEFAQTPGNLTEATKALFDVIVERTLRVPVGANDLREQVLNAVTVETPRGYRLAKEKMHKKIDACAALSFACWAAMQAGKPQPSVAVIMPSGGGQHAEWRRRHF